MDSPPSTGSSFTPINANGPLEFKLHPSEDQSNFGIQHCTSDDVTQFEPSRHPSALPSRQLKRKVPEDGLLEVNKRQMPFQPTPSSSPFQSFNITKPSSTSGIHWPKGTRSTTQSDLSSSHMPPQQTTMDCLRRLPDHTLQEAIFHQSASTSMHINLKGVSGPVVDHLMLYEHGSISASPPQSNFQDSSLQHESKQDRCQTGFFDSLRIPDQMVAPKSADTGNGDEYVIDEEEEEDMTRLLERAMSCVENHMPPSSVQDAWDRDSRSADEYDPTLRFSTPITSPELDGLASQATTSKGRCNRTPNSHEDLLDEDVDWNAVYSIVRSMPTEPSLEGSREAPQSKPRRYTSTKGIVASVEPAATDEESPLHPFVRPPFPNMVRDRPSVSSLSSSTVLRTCFRIGQAISQSVRCHSYRQDAILELFARVTYSSREKLSRKQHFQFADLFKDQQPYPYGALCNWRIGSLLDRQSQAFLETKDSKLCRTVCKPKRDDSAAIGWSFEVVAIEQVTWEQIGAAKKVVCEGSKESNNFTASDF